jgi:carbon monoxide dehydrogenase subunit G
MTGRRADWSKRTAKKTAGTTVALDDELVVPVSPETAWKRLDDVPLVASCLPGLVPDSLEAVGDNVFRARMVNTVMGMSANWDLKATVRPEEAERRLQLLLEGTDSRLGMKMDGVAEVLVRANEAGNALLDYTANIRVDGSLAAMGGPVIRSIVSDAIGQFVEVVGGAEPQQPASWHARLRRRLSAWWRRITRRSDTQPV